GPEMPILPLLDRPGFQRRAGKHFFIGRILPDRERGHAVALLPLHDRTLRAGRLVAEMIGQNSQALRLGELSDGNQADKRRQQNASFHAVVPLDSEKSDGKSHPRPDRADLDETTTFCPYGSSAPSMFVLLNRLS